MAIFKLKFIPKLILSFIVVVGVSLPMAAITTDTAEARTDNYRYGKKISKRIYPGILRDIGNAIAWGLSVVNNGLGSEEAAKFLNDSAAYCTKWQIDKNLPFKVGYKCYPPRLKSKCDRGVARLRIHQKWVPKSRHLGYLAVRWKTDGSCQESQADCTWSALSGHCTDRVWWGHGRTVESYVKR